MKKLVLAVALCAASAMHAVVTDPLKAYGSAPAAPAGGSSLPGMEALGSLGGLVGGAAGAVKPIPDLNVGIGIATTITEQQLAQSQHSTIGSGAQGAVTGGVQQGQSATQTATGGSTASGMTKR